MSTCNVNTSQDTEEAVRRIGFNCQFMCNTHNWIERNYNNESSV